MSQVLAGDTLHRLLHAYKRALRRAYDDERLGLGVAQIRTLKAIRGLAPCSASEISARLTWDKAQLARLLSDLDTRGLVCRSPSPDDGRRQRLTLSDAGQAMLARVDACEQRAHSHLAKGLSEAELAAFEALAQRLIDNLERPTPSAD
ncbi:MarR family transcriptional regulator [Salinicola endophyticus]|uniref:MarR family transcriptional regulator n=1 Tax=Salinicola endophyticus TaxID=1949083 RepID=A0ABY8FI36_9GAMM|nr:MarR family winged helix-turn-helix transcriptional regulator [Salinicola endophyticus]WFF42470.1 MarR family transcriptional regulator [Salinicola endophyticus]